MQKFILFSLLILTSFTQTIFTQNKKLTLEEIFNSNIFSGNTVENIQWLPDGSAFTFTKRNSKNGLEDIYKHNVSSGDEELIVSSSELIYNNTLINMSHYSWTEDGQYLLIAGPETAIWRHSRQAPYYLLNINTKKINALSENSPNLRNVKLSPNGKWVGYIKDHNLYINELASNKEIQLTNDGNDDILNGEFDWVYEEEFSIADGWRWSPDSKKIAFWKLDQTRVKSFYLDDEMSTYNKIYALKYPKAGEQNSKVNIVVIDIDSRKASWMDLKDIDNFYIPRIYWTNSSSKIAIEKLNRQQNQMELLMADAEDGKSNVVITDTDSCWVESEHNITFLKQSDKIILTSEMSGYNHAYIYDYDGKLINQITSGNWEVSKLIGADEENNLLYFMGKKDSPIEQQLYRVNFDGKNLKKISKNHGWHEANFSPNYKYFIQYSSNAETPTQVTLNKADGSLIAMLEENIIEAAKEYGIAYPKFIKVKTSDGTELNAYIIKPLDFDSTKKYPVVVFGYGGPGSQQVVDRWGSGKSAGFSRDFLWHNYLLQHGYLIFCIDNRGTGGRGKSFKNLVYGDLGKWSVHDQIEGKNYLSSLPFVDGKRIGFWGWSGGGYLALMLMTKGAGNFKAAIAVAPVSDFHLYDDIWTERYMGLPNENAAGYKSASALTYADKLKGKLLMVHGTMDDNVHFQNTLQMVNKLEQNAKQFDLMIYPDKNHGISGGLTRLHLFTKMTDFFLNNL